MKSLSLGLIPYQKALDLQIELWSQVKNNPASSFLLFCEHPSVITLGKNASHSNIISSQKEFASLGIEIVQSDRGGQVTMHMPGQLVIYPILKPSNFGLSVRSYVEFLEQAIIELLQEYKIKSHSHPGFPGIWCEQDKICAIGIRIKHHVSYHGLALNVNNDLALFSHIVPCGLQDKGLTSMKNILGEDIPTDQIISRFTKIISEKVYLLSQSYDNGRKIVENLPNSEEEIFGKRRWGEQNIKATTNHFLSNPGEKQ